MSDVCTLTRKYFIAQKLLTIIEPSVSYSLFAGGGSDLLSMLMATDWSQEWLLKTGMAVAIF